MVSSSMEKKFYHKVLCSVTLVVKSPIAVYCIVGKEKQPFRGTYYTIRNAYIVLQGMYRNKAIHPYVVHAKLAQKTMSDCLEP